MFTFCPLQGALSESTACQSLLELDGGVKILVDLGWDESFDTQQLKELERYYIFYTAFPGIVAARTDIDLSWTDKCRPCH